MLPLSKFITKHHSSISLTVISTADPSSISSVQASITYHQLPTVIPPSNLIKNSIELFFEIPCLYNPNLREALIEISKKSKIRAFVIDFLCNSAFEGLNLYIKMRRRGVIPVKQTFPFDLKACSNLKFIWCCEQVHGHVLRFGFDFDSHVVNGLVRGYSVVGVVSDARKMLDELCEKSLSIWTTMVCCYAQNSCVDEAIRLFEGMILDGFEPNAVILSSVTRRTNLATSWWFC